MFGGGEEYFREPDEIDRDTLRRFAAFCAQLRNTEKVTNKAITKAAQLAYEVGNSEEAFELVIGALFRHIKSWTGKKQLACWYILDKLCKEDREKYAHTASKYILDIGRDYIPYEDPVLAPQYESLVEHWDHVFPKHVVIALWTAKSERLWAVQHPDEIAQQQEVEEKQWEKEELDMQEEDGLNEFGQPCMDYLQGRCFWGESCRLLHPPGLENTLPPECRMGDWKCPSCGVINRHFRRRCSSCVREKPQYRKAKTMNTEDAMLCNPDSTAVGTLSRQFGYDPLIAEDAVAHWKMRLEDVPIEQYLEERRAAYRVRILGKAPTSDAEKQMLRQKNYPEVDIGPPEDDMASSHAGVKRARYESSVPPGTAPVDAMALLAQLVVERGAHDSRVPLLLYELSKAAKQVSTDPSASLTGGQADAFTTTCKLVFAAWSTNPSATTFASPFFSTIRDTLGKIGLSSSQREQIEMMCKQF